MYVVEKMKELTSNLVTIYADYSRIIVIFGEFHIEKLMVDPNVVYEFLEEHLSLSFSLRKEWRIG